MQFRESLQRCFCQHPHSPCCQCRHVVNLLHSMGQLPEFAHYTVHRNIGYLRAATCAFSTNLARWQFPYENRLLEIMRESCDFSYVSDALLLKVTCCRYVCKYLTSHILTFTRSVKSFYQQKMVPRKYSLTHSNRARSVYYWYEYSTVVKGQKYR